MATVDKLRSDLAKLKTAYEKESTDKNLKPKIKAQIDRIEKEIEAKKEGKKVASTSASTKVLMTKLKQFVAKNKKYSRYGNTSENNLEKDAVRNALKIGKRYSEGKRSNQYGSKSDNKGNVYYEYRTNRHDVKQPKSKQSYPILEEGGMTTREILKTMRSSPTSERKQELAKKIIPFINPSTAAMSVASQKKMAGGYMAGGGYVAVSEKDGYWYILSKPTSKASAQKVINIGGFPKGETQKVVTVEQAKAHKKIIGEEYLIGGGYMAGGGLVIESEKDIEEVAKYMTTAVKKRRWDLKDLIYYFEKDNDYDYKLRVKIWDDMNVYEMPKTYDNIYKLLKAIVDANNSSKSKMSAGGYMAKGGVSKKFRLDDVVYNKKTKTIGIVRLEDERGEIKTDADGNVNTSELQHYNPLKYPHQSDAKVAPSTKKEIEERGLFNPFKKMESGGYMAGGGTIEEGDYVMVKPEKLEAEVIRITGKNVVVEFTNRRPEGGDKRGNYKLSDLKKMSDGGYMAKGGAIAHGLKAGDMVYKISSINNKIIFITNGGKKYRLNIATGERKSLMEEGGQLDNILLDTSTGNITNVGGTTFLDLDTSGIFKHGGTINSPTHRINHK